MGKDTPLFVAETNEHGEVVWVWRSESQGGRPRAVKTPARHLGETGTARFSGAPSAEIIDWLARRADQSTPPVT